jgi:hypothetical protein
MIIRGDANDATVANTRWAIRYGHQGLMHSDIYHIADFWLRGGPCSSNHALLFSAQIWKQQVVVL